MSSASLGAPPIDEAPAVDHARVDRLVDEAIGSVLTGNAASVLARDAACLVLCCGACRAVWTVVYRFEHSPYTGQVGSLLYGTCDEARAACADLLVRRNAAIAREDWESSRVCDCGAPAHHTQAIASHLIRQMVGSGAALVLSAAPGSAVSSARAAVRALPMPIASGDIEREFGRPLTLFDAWQRLRDATPEVSCEHLEAGVTGWLADDPAALRAAIERHTASGPHVVVMLDRAVVERGVWPAALGWMAARLERGAAALVVDRAVMLRSVRALALPDGTSIEHTRAERFEVQHDDVTVGIFPHRIVLSMARWGLTLADACALALDEASVSVARVRAFLTSINALRPGTQFEIDGRVAHVIRADGSRGRSFFLGRAPVHLEPGTEDLAREAAFLCDEVPSWSDPTRVCPCGAPCAVQRRIVLHASVADVVGTPRSPWVLRTWERDGAPRAVEIVVLGCDRHVRVEPATLLHEHRVTEATLAGRLSADVDRATFFVDIEVLEDDRGHRAIVGRGHLAASLILEPRWLSGLHAYAGHPITSGMAEAWAFGPDGMCLLDRQLDDAQRQRLAELTMAAGGVPPGAPAPFAIRVEHDSNSEPAGDFRPVPPQTFVIE